MRVLNKKTEVRSQESECRRTKAAANANRLPALCLILLAAAAAAFANGPSMPAFFVPLGDGFLAQTPDLRAAFGPRSVVFQVHSERLELRFAGASARVTLEGADPLGARVNI